MSGGGEGGREWSGRRNRRCGFPLEVEWIEAECIGEGITEAWWILVATVNFATAATVDHKNEEWREIARIGGKARRSKRRLRNP